MPSIIHAGTERPVESLSFPMGSEGPAAIKIHTTPPPAPRARGGRPGRYQPVYEAIETMQAGDWLVVPGTEGMPKQTLWKAAGAIRHWVNDHKYDDVLRVCIDCDGRLVVYHVTKQDKEQ